MKNQQTLDPLSFVFNLRLERADKEKLLIKLRAPNRFILFIYKHLFHTFVRITI